MVKTNLVFSGYVRCKKCKKYNMTFQHGACDCKRRNLECGVIVNGRFMPYSEVKTRVLSGHKFMDGTHAGLPITASTFGIKLKK